MSGFEGIGEAVTGGMLARAVEPSAGEAAHAQGQACLNCGTELEGDYCHHCGQPAHIHRTMGAFFHDLLHSVLHFEGKTWRTLPMLAFRPGELTRRYIAGERARFVSPMALFLFSVFMMFAVFSWIGGPFASNSNMAKAAQQESRASIEQELAEARTNLDAAVKDLAAAKAAGESTRSEERDVKDARSELAVLEQAAKIAVPIVADKAKADAPAPAKAGAETKNADTLEEGLEIINANTGFSPLDGALAHITENPKLTLYKLQSNAYKFSWALIPLSVPLVWSLFFWKRRFGLYDHTVFVTYSISAMSFGVILLSLLRPLGMSEGISEAAIAFLPPIHIYKQVKGAYGLSRFSALWRTMMLIMFAFIASTWFFTLLLGIGALG